MENEMMERSEILLYSDENGKEFVSVVFKDETFWLTQKAMAELFGCTPDNISLHLKNIFAESELNREAVTEKFSATAADGKNYLTQHYNLDAIIAVGYRVNSKKATRFRQWATKTLKEYIQKGFVLNDELMKNGRPFGKDYFDELLERIREIRASERRAYQKIADVFEQCSYDYDKNSDTTKAFYAFVQNKLHYAVTGKTAAELISERATLDSPTMGLTTWKGAPDGKILKSDTLVAKNYLNEKELSRLNRLVTMFIDYAELMAEDEQLMSMQDWLNETDRFLTNNRRKVLDGKSDRGSHQGVMAKAAPFPYVGIGDVIDAAGKSAEQHDGRALVIILDHITDAGNLGAVSRSAEAVGACGIVIPNKRSAHVEASTYKSSAGAIAHVPVAQVSNLVQTMSRLKEEGFWIAGATEHAKDLIWKSNLKGKIALVMGNEQEGISRLVMEHCDFLVKLPIEGEVASLNVAQAATACMYEWLRQNQ